MVVGDRRQGQKGRKGRDCEGHFVCSKELDTVISTVEKALIKTMPRTDLSYRVHRSKIWF